MKIPTLEEMRRITGILTFQYGREICNSILSGNIKVKCSKRTGKIRYIYRDEKLVSVVRPKDGRVALTLEGAKLAMRCSESDNFIVRVRDDVSEYIAKGGDVFAKHVLQVDGDIRSGEDVIVCDGKGRLLAVGVALLSGVEMRSFTHGVAVKTRKGIFKAH